VFAFENVFDTFVPKSWALLTAKFAFGSEHQNQALYE
jgi:hypothetical protein